MRGAKHILYTKTPDREVFVEKRILVTLSCVSDSHRYSEVTL